MSKNYLLLTDSATQRILLFAIAISLLSLATPVLAFEHHDSLVEFQEYNENIVVKNRHQNKPYFLLFSAEWCHWCREFGEKTLVHQDVADYLNDNFINIFIDTDIHPSAYVKYQATGVPYTVFLNPDGSLYYQYAGTLYRKNFLEVLKEVLAEVGTGKYALGMEPNNIDYTPSSSLEKSELEALGDIYRDGVLDNFDDTEYGLGKGQKLILPRTFLYLLDQAGADQREEVAKKISMTLDRAIDRIYDPIEGGFFRYAETRTWQVPHYEKFADLNAGAVLLMYRINQVSPSPKLVRAADQTLGYLSSTLFDNDIGTFLSFQVADTYYYSVDKKQREISIKPKVMDKVFTDRLANTLAYLIQVIELTGDKALQSKVNRSLDFLSEMIMQNSTMNRYYDFSRQQWQLQSGLSDYAFVAKLFTDAATYFKNPGYTQVASKVLQTAIKQFYDRKTKIFIDPNVDDSSNVEYLMEMNALFAQSIMAIGERLDPGGSLLVESSVTYFSRMAEPLEDRLWNANSWAFTEAYVPYLEVVDKFVNQH